jgi:glucosamine-6-phosphate deaminase
MQINISNNIQDIGRAAGNAAADAIKSAIHDRGEANIILATGTSQFEVLKQLISEKQIDWANVNMFHLDEYIGLPVSSPASFRRYLNERFLAKIPPLKSVHLIDGEGDAAKECERLGKLIRGHPIDLALVGIGENGHIAFNDPPADFETREPYIIVALDENCRKQQLGEGWFKEINDVPSSAISMSVHQIMLSQKVICSVPDKRKADAVKNCLKGPVSNLFPASILQTHPDCTIWLDRESAALL